MTKYTEPLEILRGHLEEIYSALDAAYGYHVSYDLSQQYRNVGGTTRQSNLTKRIEKALNHAEGYLNKEDENVPEE